MIGKTRVESQAARAAEADVAERGQRPGRRPAQRVGNTDKVSLPPSPATGCHRLLSHSGQSSPRPATRDLPAPSVRDQSPLPAPAHHCPAAPAAPAASTATAACLLTPAPAAHCSPRPQIARTNPICPRPASGRRDLPRAAKPRLDFRGPAGTD